MISWCLGLPRLRSVRSSAESFDLVHASSRASVAAITMSANRSGQHLVLLFVVVGCVTVHEGHQHGSSNMQQIEHMPTAAAGNHTAAAAAAANTQHPCMMAFNSSACANYTYPRAFAAQDIHSLCSAMPFMAACSVAEACNASGAGPDATISNPTAADTVNSTASNSTSNISVLVEPQTEMGSGNMSSHGIHEGVHGHQRSSSMHGMMPDSVSISAFNSSSVSANNTQICDPWQHVVTVCKLDEGMSRMAGCDNWRALCAEGSQVPGCSATGLAALPTSPTLNAQVRSICEEMTMDGCERCMPSWQAGKMWADCDLLDTYSYLCYQMPDMSQCTEWHAMCQADATLSFCYPTSRK